MGMVGTKGCLRNKTLDNFINKKSLVLNFLVFFFFFKVVKKLNTHWHID